MANALSYAMPEQENPLSPIPTTTSPAPAAMRPGPRKNALQMTAPRPAAPMRKVSPRNSASPNALAAAFAPSQQKPDAMYAFMDTLQRSVDPAAAQAREQKLTADQQAKLTQGLAFVQQMKQLPMEQRMAFARQGASQFGVGDFGGDPNAFTDEALAQSIATLSAHLGQAPAAPEYMNLGGGNVGMTQGGQFSMVREAPGEPVKPTVVNNRVLDPNDPTKVLADYSDQEPDQPEYTYENFDGAVWAVDKRDPTKRTRLGSAPQGTQANPPETYRSLTPDEVAARGYSPGTVVQVDSRGREFVNARPSTAQTGQPTEGERNAGMHVGVSLNGLQNITTMEGRGYNRAGVGEQFSTLFGENEKLYDQAAAEFIDGYLRAMTGAAATATEIDTYRKQWFPQFGDNEKVVKQKAAGRLNAIQAMKSKAGRSWNPAWDSVIDQLAAQVGGAANNIAPPPATPASAADLGDDELRAMLGLD